MEPRKKCVACGKYLIAFQNCYLHPESPCSGIMDYIDIEATISDNFMHEKFEELYGKPELDDYDKLNLLDKNPLIKLIIFISGLFKKKIK